MACLIPLLLLLLPLATAQAPAGAPSESPSITFFSAAPSPSSIAAAPPEIGKICRATRFPDVCASSMAKSITAGRTPPVVDIIKSAITVSVVHTISAQEKVTKILEGANNNLNKSVHSANCLEELSNAMLRLQSSLDVLPERTKDARAWMSAAVGCHYNCHNNFKYVNDSAEIHNLMLFFESVGKMTSNALSLVRSFDLFGPDTGKWVAPKTERDGYFEPVKSKNLEFPTNFPASLKIDATVSKDQTGHKTIQEAVDAALSNLTDKKFVIHIKEGIYEENVRVPLEKKNLVFLGDGIGKTVITGKLAVGPPGLFTYNSATVAVMGDGFMAKNITFKNAAETPNKAVAFRSDSDKSYYENCEFIGHQDTLHCHLLRQFYKSCRIEGRIDFIFGNAAAYFKDCEIFVNPRLVNPEKGEKNALTAHGRTDPGQSTGLVFDNCSVTGTPEYMKLYESNSTGHKDYLGRPWKDFSRTVFMRSTLDKIIDPAGWLEWEGNQSLSTLYYGEFENKGKGADLSGRVKWSSKIPPEHVSTFSIQNFIQGDEWLPKA